MKAFVFMRDESIDLARVWLVYAQEDLAIARQILDDFPAGSAFHVQQAIEKALKSAIILAGIEPPRTHDLRKLSIVADNTVAWSMDDVSLDGVTDWAASSRYPSEIGSPRPQSAEVNMVIIKAEALLQELRNKLA